MSQVSLTLPAPPVPELLPLPIDWESQATPAVLPSEIGGCGLPMEPIDPATVRGWELETEALEVPTRIVGGAVQAELSGFEEDDDLGGESVPEGDDDDEFDDFDDIDEDDFDDDFDDDFEEELDDDYEIEIEDEISAEFGLSGIPGIEIDDIEDIDAVDDVEIDIDPDSIDEKE